MYCVKCGVELADSERACPLCGTEVIVPGGEKREIKPSLYPQYPGQVYDGMTKRGIFIVVSLFFLIPTLLCLCCDLTLNHRIVWSGITMLSTAFVYIAAVLPACSPKKLCGELLLSVDFAALLGLLLYINCKTGGHWFLSLAFPLVGIIGLVSLAFTVLRKRFPQYRLIIYGSTLIFLGLLSILAEFLVCLTFTVGKMFTWCFYPLIVFTVLGAFLIILGFDRDLKEIVRRKLFF